MNKKEINSFSIRNFNNSDLEQIGQFNKVLQLSYAYNMDCVSENIFCAVNESEDVLAVAHLEPHDTWNLIESSEVSDSFGFKLKFELCLNPEYAFKEEIKDELVQAILKRAADIKKLYLPKRILLTKWYSSDDIGAMDYLLSKGFCMSGIVPVMKFDLTKQIPQFDIPEEIKIIEFKMESEEDFSKYHQAEMAAFEGSAWRLNYLKWMQGAPGLVNFTAFYKDEPIGNTSVWYIDEKRWATENVFVTFDWRNKNIAKALISTALKYLKANGKQIASLGTSGTNKKAIRLYKSLGYELDYTLLELVYEV